MHDSFAIAALRDDVTLDLDGFSTKVIFDAHIDLFEEYADEGFYAGAVEILSRADEYTDELADRKHILASYHSRLCADSSGALSSAQRSSACGTAQARALELDNDDLIFDVCATATDADSLSRVQSACQEMMARVLEKNDFTASLDACALANFDEMEAMVSPACGQVEALAEQEADAAEAVSMCLATADSLSIEIVESVCQQAVSLAILEEGEIGQRLNVQLCYDLPNSYAALTTRACDRSFALLPPLESGFLLSRSVTSSEGDLWRYTGPVGALVTIDAMATDGSLDTMLEVRSSDGTTVLVDPMMTYLMTVQTHAFRILK